MIERLIDLSNGALLSMFCLWALYFLSVECYEAPKRLRLWTGILMLVLSAQTLLWIVCSMLVPDKVEDTGASVTVGLLAAPFAVFVMMELTRLSRVTWQRAVVHVSVPLVLASVYVAQLIWTLQGRYVTLLLYSIGMGCYIVYYVFRFVSATRHYEQIVGDIYADVEGRTINWLKRVFGILLGIIALFVVLIILVEDKWTLVAYNMLEGVFWLVLCHNISLMRDNEAIEISEEPQSQTITDETPQWSHKEEHSEMISDLKTLMVEQQLYLQSNLTRETAAKALGTNHIELTRRIKSETGMTFSQFVTSIRLEHAAELLTSTTMTVDEILYACGFKSNSTFYRQFAERYHYSPIEYRQQGRTQNIAGK